MPKSPLSSCIFCLLGSVSLSAMTFHFYHKSLFRYRSNNCDCFPSPFNFGYCHFSYIFVVTLTCIFVGKNLFLRQLISNLARFSLPKPKSSLQSFFSLVLFSRHSHVGGFRHDNGQGKAKQNITFTLKS